MARSFSQFPSSIRGPFALPAGNLTRYEEALCQNRTGPGPVLAEASRSARLQLDEELARGELSQRAHRLNRLGAQVAGPVMVGFTLWIAEQVREHAIDHLGYLARDGELPQLIAQRTPDPTLAEVGQTYLQLNRLSVTLATAATVGVEEWVEAGTRSPADFLRSRIHLISFGGLLQRLGFEPADVATVAGSSNVLAGLDPALPLPGELLEAWLDLLADQGTQELIGARAVERKAALVDYLAQNRVLSARQPAFVDVGWRGRMAHLIDTALLEHFSARPIHLHFGGDQVPPETDRDLRIHRFAFPGTFEIPPFENPPEPVETITASGRPRVVDYRRDSSGAVHPVLQPMDTDVGRADRAELWRGALTMADRLPTAATMSSWDLDSVPLDREVRELLRLWWYHPDRDEALALTSFAFEGDEAGAQVRPVVAPYRLGEIAGRNRQARQWRQGSQVLSSPPAKLGLRVAMAARRALGRGTQRR